MAIEQVRLWRSPGQSQLLLIAGITTHYTVDPRGEYVFGVIERNAMQARRGRQRYGVGPGKLVAWDPCNAHTGVTPDGRPWAARLMVVETADLIELAGDSESTGAANNVIPNPVVSDPLLTREFLALHRTLEVPTNRLQTDERLCRWLHAFLTRHSTWTPNTLTNSRDQKAVRLAQEYIADQAHRNIGLSELAAVAGVEKFRLVKVFKHETGLPPHAFQLAHRVRLARRLLEAGNAVADVASTAGFADQSHLHRHFRRTLGMTPQEYRERFARAPSPIRNPSSVNGRDAQDG